MPCEDITEVLKMRLDANERVFSYELNKRTCGRAVGEASLLGEWVLARTAAEVLDVSIDDFMRDVPASDEAEEFLTLKHFFALRMGMAVLTGLEPGRASDPCAIARLAYEPEGIEFEAEIRIDAVTEQIRSCGRCGKMCGTRHAAGAAH